MSEFSIENRQNEEIVRVNHSLFHSVGDLDQLRELARGASLEITQLGPGTMQGALAHVDLGLSSIHLNCFNLPARGRGSVAADRWTFVVFPEGTEGNFNSIDLDSSRMLVYPPNSEFEGRVTRPFQDWVFTVDHEHFVREYLLLTQLSDQCLPRGVKSYLPDPRSLNGLRLLAKRTIKLIDGSMDVLDGNRIRSSLHQQLTHRLCNTMFSAMRDPRRVNRRQISHHRVVKCCDEFLRTDVGNPATISDLCLLSGVSERTLRNAFKNTTGLSPNAYLKAMRLNRVRIELERPKESPSTVTSVAMSCGFVHLGDFARDYKRFFGESPSITLQRSS